MADGGRIRDWSSDVCSYDRCAAEPKMRPRQDPVLHGDWVPNAPLSAEQAAHFDREGYLVLENIFSTEEVVALQAETARLLASPAELAEDTVITEPGGKEIRSIFQIHAQSNLLRRLRPAERPVGKTGVSTC